MARQSSINNVDRQGEQFRATAVVAELAALQAEVDALKRLQADSRQCLHPPWTPCSALSSPAPPKENY